MNERTLAENRATYGGHRKPPWWGWLNLAAALALLVAMIVITCTATEAQAWFGDVAKAIGSATEAGFEAKWKLELLRTIERNSDKLLLVVVITVPALIMLAVLALATYLFKLAHAMARDGWSRRELIVFGIGAAFLVAIGLPAMDFATHLADGAQTALAVLNKAAQ